MPPMPIGIMIFAMIIIIPLFTSFLLTWLLAIQNFAELSSSEMIRMIYPFQVSATIFFIISIPPIIAFWSRHPQRYAIALICYLTSIAIIPYMFCLYWSLSKPGKKILPPPPLPVYPQFGQAMMARQPTYGESSDDFTNEQNFPTKRQ